MTALNATDGYSILLTPPADNTEIDRSISVSGESADHAGSAHPAIEDNVKSTAQGRRGLQDFACFQYSDTLVAY